MDWFERLTGFREESYQATKSRLEIDGEQLRSNARAQPMRVGSLELPSLADLRARVAAQDSSGDLRFGVIQGDVRALHRAIENEGALFQVASQFNLLEMVGPDVTPEEGVTRYQWDRTQGPACAIAAGAATLYRNYFVPVGEQTGQTADCQLDALADMREMLSDRIGMQATELWTMSNGYPIANRAAIEAVGEWLEETTENERDKVRSKLRVGLHWDVEVTDEPEAPGLLVSQAFCSAIPVSYSRLPSKVWEPLARLILEAAYEATFAAAAVNVARGRSNTLYLTRLGGGAFGNPLEWIDSAIDRACRLFARHPLYVALVEYRRS